MSGATDDAVTAGAIFRSLLDDRDRAGELITEAKRKYEPLVRRIKPSELVGLAEAVGEELARRREGGAMETALYRESRAAIRQEGGSE